VKQPGLFLALAFALLASLFCSGCVIGNPYAAKVDHAIEKGEAEVLYTSKPFDEFLKTFAEILESVGYGRFIYQSADGNFYVVVKNTNLAKALLYGDAMSHRIFVKFTRLENNRTRIDLVNGTTYLVAKGQVAADIKTIAQKIEETNGVTHLESNAAREEANQLYAEAMPFAEKMLNEHGEFHPYGGVINKEGKIEFVGIYEGNEHPDPQNLVETYKNNFRDKAKAGEIRVAVIIYDAKVTKPGTQEKVDAIVAELDHRDGYSVAVATPYTIEKNEPLIGASFASKGENKIFKEGT